MDSFVVFSDLFPVILDMLSALIHGTRVPDSSEKGGENSKAYQNLIRKLKVRECNSICTVNTQIFLEF